MSIHSSCITFNPVYMNIIIKYSCIHYNRILCTNYLIFIHSVLVIPGMGVVVYVLKDYLINPLDYMLSYVLFIMFLLQTALIVGKRFKNEFFFSPRSYTIFPQKNTHIFLYRLFFDIIDINVILMLVVTLLTIVYVTQWSFLVIMVFSAIFVLCEITYLLYLMATIDIMTQKYGNSKNVFLITFSLFFCIELFTRFGNKFYLFNFYPISGWIGSTVRSTITGDINHVFFNFGSTFLVAIIGLYILNGISFPRKENVSN
jgi:hypothetical protein